MDIVGMSRWSEDDLVSRLVGTVDWLTNQCLWERDRVRNDFRIRSDIVSRWEPRPCPPHPEFCPAGGQHVWLSDGDERGAYIACDHCGADAEGRFYPEEERCDW